MEEKTVLTAYVLDDEEPAIVKLKLQLSQFSSVSVVGASQLPSEAIEEIQQKKPDVVFLDINMSTLDGFDVLPFLPNTTAIVFTTACEHHAVKAFEKSAVDYLLKPFDSSRLLQAIDKVRNLHSLSAQDKAANNEYPIGDRLISKQGDRIFFVKTNDVYYFKSSQSIVYACTENKVFPITASLEKLEIQLSSQGFIRFHRSYIINSNYIKEVQRWFGGKLVVIMSDKNETEITSSRDGARAFKLKFGL